MICDIIVTKSFDGKYIKANIPGVGDRVVEPRYIKAEKRAAIPTGKITAELVVVKGRYVDSYLMRGWRYAKNDGTFVPRDEHRRHAEQLVDMETSIIDDINSLF